MKEATSSKYLGTLILGYWDEVPDGAISDTDPSGQDVRIKCRATVACLYGAGTYPTIGQLEPFCIEEPLHWPSQEDRVKWAFNLERRCIAERRIRTPAIDPDPRVRPRHRAGRLRLPRHAEQPGSGRSANARRACAASRSGGMTENQCR